MQAAEDRRSNNDGMPVAVSRWMSVQIVCRRMLPGPKLVAHVAILCEIRVGRTHGIHRVVSDMQDSLSRYA